MVGLTECCNRGVLDGGAIMVVPLQVFKRSKSIPRSTLIANRNLLGAD